MMIKEKKSISGQMMVMMVVLLSVAALGAAALGAFLVLSGFRNLSSSDTTMDSIFVADTGIECVLFNEFGHAAYNAVSGYCPAIAGNNSSNKTTEKGIFSFKKTATQPTYEDWSSTGVSTNGKTTRVLDIRFNKKT